MASSFSGVLVSMLMVAGGCGLLVAIFRGTSE